ncbi:S1C family serine protease [Lapidilactobacillus gannanensis]|jgi:serine protease Do|uniref:S1C family serine protease n=1 Tax=Lapidilactobacillus gannanensis TaxID=2486002 RepID=A0ABW4BRU7_9LACO|nr:trypsin-like peptidase domain-containing protein [Lapidilactobacillus gannanensis]MCH4056952.1 trypsin-like peptidase domain-containing protein [Lactobacillaceae bacterium]
MSKRRIRRGITWWQIAVIAVVSALIGGGVAFAGFSMVGRSSSDTATDSSGTTGTTKVSNVSVKTSSSMTKAFTKVEGAVVSVINEQRQSQNNSSDIFSDLFGSRGNSKSSGSSDSSSGSGTSSSELETVSEGSGLIYAKQNGTAYVVTNNHVVSGSDALQVILADGTKVSAKIVGADATSDLAVLSISAAKVTTVATFGDSSKITPAEPVIAIGSPLGSEYATSVTEGIVSAKNRTIDVTDDTTGQTTGQATVIQTDAAINPGNSGGPLVNSSGQVIGINSLKYAQNTDGTSVEGMGFAYPSNEVVQIIDQLVKNGKVVRPALGVGVVDLTNISADQQKSTLKLPTNITSGVVIASVESGGPAAKAGLKKYDTIVGIDSKKVTSIAEVHTAIYAHSIGDTVTVKYYRDGKLQETKVTLTKEASSTTSSNSSSSN